MARSRSLIAPLLLFPVITVDGIIQCGSGEHEHNSRCCQDCPSGFYVSRYCSEHPADGRCDVCPQGTYTAHSSGMSHCLSCTDCQHNEEVVVDCTTTRNRQCRCKPGYYRDPVNDVICRACQRGPAGAILPHPCNATTDAEVVKGRGKWLWSLVSIPAVLGILFLAYLKKKQGFPSIIQFFKERTSASSSLPPSSGLDSEAFLLNDASPDRCVDRCVASDVDAYPLNNGSFSEALLGGDSGDSANAGVDLTVLTEERSASGPYRTPPGCSDSMAEVPKPQDVLVKGDPDEAGQL